MNKDAWFMFKYPIGNASVSGAAKVADFDMHFSPDVGLIRVDTPLYFSSGALDPVRTVVAVNDFVVALKDAKRTKRFKPGFIIAKCDIMLHRIAEWGNIYGDIWIVGVGTINFNRGPYNS